MSGSNLTRKLMSVAVATASLVAADVALSQSMLEEVVVTARKRVENLQEVPMAVAAFSAGQLADYQVEDITDLQRMTPNITINETSGLTAGSLQVYIRGIGSEPGFDAGVGIYVDDVYLTSDAGSLVSVYDIESIEVLKGPQGHLYGRNTIGGAIKYISKAPTEEFEGSAEFKAGNDGLMQFKGSVSGSLIGDTLLGGLGVMYRESDGYQESIDDGSDWGVDDITGLRGTLVWNATDNVSVKLVGDLMENDSKPLIPVRQALNPDGNSVAFSLPLSGYDPGFAEFGIDNVTDLLYGEGAALLEPLDQRIYKDLPGEDEDTISTNVTDRFKKSYVDTESLAATIDWDINDQWSLKSISAYRKVENQRSFDFDASIDFTLDSSAKVDYTSYSQEFQFHYSGDDIKAVAGLYYLDNLQEQPGSGSGINTAPAGPWVYFAQNHNDLIRREDSEVISQSVYFNVDWDFSENWQLSLGGRYTEDEKSLDLVKDTVDDFVPFAFTDFGVIGIPGLVVPLAIDPDYAIANPDRFAAVGGLFHLNVPGVPGGVLPMDPNGDGTFLVEGVETFKDEKTFREFTPSVKLAHFLNEDTMVYAGYSTGFKSGGFNNNEDGSTYDPETVDAYVLGIKTTMLDSTLRLNAEVFFNDYADKQLGAVQVADDGAIIFINDNVGEAEGQGFEAEISWLPPIEGLSFDLNIGYLDSEIKKFKSVDAETGEEIDIADDHVLPYQPEWTGLVRANYSFGLGDGNLFLSADVNYRDEMYVDGAPVDETSDFETQALSGSLTTYNAVAIYTTADEKWRFALEGKNLSDEREMANAFTVVDWMSAGYNRGRTYAFSVGYNF